MICFPYTKVMNAYEFDVTSDGLAWIESPRAGAELRFRSFRDGTETLLWTLEKRSDFGIDLRPDLGVVLFTQVDQESTELMLVEGFRRP